MHYKKLSYPKNLIFCPKEYSIDENELNGNLWEANDVPSGRSRQGLSDSINSSKICKHENKQTSVPDEMTAVHSGLSYSSDLNHIEKDPQLIAITRVNQPIKTSFEGREVILSDLTVMSELHLKDRTIEEVKTHLFLHGHYAIVNGKTVELEAFINNEILPPECKDFHYSKK